MILYYNQCRLSLPALVILQKVQIILSITSTTFLFINITVVAAGLGVTCSYYGCYGSNVIIAVVGNIHS